MVPTHTRFENQGVVVRWQQGTLDTAVGAGAGGSGGGEVGSEAVRESRQTLFCVTVSEVRDGGGR